MSCISSWKHQRERRTLQDSQKQRQSKQGQGEVLTEAEKITDRWTTYFATLLNEENPRTITGDGVLNCGVTRGVTRVEVEGALKKKKNAKAAGPDEIPAKAWKILGNEGVDKFTELMQKIWKEETKLEEWRSSVITPIHKGKGDIQDYKNSFKYFGSTIRGDGELEEEIEKRIQGGWRNWKRFSGVLCDRRLSAKSKGKVCKVAVRPTLTYGAETWNIKKTQEKKLCSRDEDVEMGMRSYQDGQNRKQKKFGKE